MSRLACRCGFVMAVHTMVEDFLYDFVPQKVLDELVEKWDTDGEKITLDDFFDYYNQFRLDAYKCPSCGRILIEREDRCNVFRSYIEEN